MSTDTVRKRLRLPRRLGSLAGRSERPDHRLAFLDQTAFELMRATGRGQLMQCIWIYEHPVDFAGLDRFQAEFAKAIAGRLIEPSPLPFGRPRWVATVTPPLPIRVAEHARPRSEVLDWADELAGRPIDPQFGPGWFIEALPLTDGSTAITLIGSHCLADGTAAILSVFEAVIGNIRDLGYLRQGSRPRYRAMAADLGQVVLDLPVTARALVAAAKVAYQKRRDFRRSSTAPTPPGAGQRNDHHVVVPNIAIFVDVADWDARAESLGGNSYSLLAGFAAKLGERMGRQRAADGATTLVIAINERESLDDTRALAMSFANAAVDPVKVTVDLTEARTVVRAARESARTTPDPTFALLPLMPWLSRRAVKGIAELLFAYGDDLPVSCSNLGDLPSELARVDGTEAEFLLIRAVDQNVTHHDLERSHGQLVVVSGRINGKVSIAVEGYEIGAANSKARLRDIAAQTLAEFDLTGTIE